MQKDVILSNLFLCFFIFTLTNFLFALFIYISNGKKVNWIRVFIFAVCCAIISLLTRIYCSMDIIFFSSIIFSITFALIILKFNIIESIIGVFFATIAGAPGEIFLAFLSSLIGITNTTSLTKPYFLIIYTIITSSIYLLIISIIYNIRFKIDFVDDINKKRNINIIINCIITLFLIAPNILFFSTSNLDIPKSLIIFNIVSVFVFFALALYNTLRGAQLNSKSQQLENQLLYNKTLTDLINNLRGFRHDFSNTLNAINGYLSLNDIDGLKKYFNELKSDYSTINSLSFANMTIINNPPIYGLIVSKFYNASAKNILVNLDISTDIIHSKMRIYELCKILGIFWDNAIEASQNSENKIVNFVLKEIDTNYVITIENSVSDNVNIQDIFKKDYSTKGENRGIGLWEVKHITDKYKYVNLKTSTGNNMFKHEMSIEIDNRNRVHD